MNIFKRKAKEPAVEPDPTDELIETVHWLARGRSKAEINNLKDAIDFEWQSQNKLEKLNIDTRDVAEKFLDEAYVDGEGK